MGRREPLLTDRLELRILGQVVGFHFTGELDSATKLLPPPQLDSVKAMFCSEPTQGLLKRKVREHVYRLHRLA